MLDPCDERTELAGALEPQRQAQARGAVRQAPPPADGASAGRAGERHPGGSSTATPTSAGSRGDSDASATACTPGESMATASARMAEPALVAVRGPESNAPAGQSGDSNHTASARTHRLTAIVPV